MARRAVAAALLAGLPLAAAAAPASYRCTDGRVLQLTSTPLQAHVTLDGRRWDLQRVRESREAVYLGRRDKTRLELRGPQLDWHTPDADLHCRLVPQSIAAENVYVPPPASAPAR